MTNWPLSPAEVERIRQLTKRLRRKDAPLAEVAESLLEGRPLPPDAGASLLRALEGGWWSSANRQIAAWALGVAPLEAETFTAANRRLRKILSRRPAHNLACIIASCCIFNFWVLPFLVIFSLSDKPSNHLRELCAVSLGRMGAFDAITELSQSVKELSSSTSSGDMEVRFASAYGLYLILGRHPETAFGMLSEETVYALGTLLRQPISDAQIPVLETLRLAGSPRAIVDVKSYMRRTRVHHHLDAGARALDALEKRKQLEDQRSSLLRPAEAPATDGSVLLRPTQAGETDQSVLLRPEE